MKPLSRPAPTVTVDSGERPRLPVQPAIVRRRRRISGSSSSYQRKPTPTVAKSVRPRRTWRRSESPAHVRDCGLLDSGSPRCGQAAMSRSIALAVVLGVLVAAMASYAVPQLALRDFVAAWQRAPDRRRLADLLDHGFGCRQ